MPDAKWIIRFVVLAFVAGLALGRPAFALDSNGGTALSFDGLTPGPSAGTAAIPGLYLYQEPEVSAQGARAGLVLYGSRVAADNGALSLTSDLYFGKTVHLADMIQAHGSGMTGAPGLLALSTAGRQNALRQGRAVAQTLAYQGRGFAFRGSYTAVDANFQGLNELIASQSQMAGLKNALGTEKIDLQATLQPLSALKLQAAYNQFTNDQPGNGERGLTRTKMHYDLAYALSGRTNFTATYDALQDVLNKSGQTTTSGTKTTAFALSHQFSSTAALQFGHQLVSATKNGQTLDTNINTAQFTYKPGKWLGLATDITRKAMSNGTVDNTTAFNVNSQLGTGAWATSLTGQWMQHVTGQGGAQDNTVTKLNLTAAGNPRLQLYVDYLNERQQGPSANKNYTKTLTTLTSHLTRDAALTMTMMNEGDQGRRLTTDRSLKFDFTPGLLRLNSRMETVRRADGKDERELESNLFLRAGKPMAEWARQASKSNVFAGVERFGVVGLAPWADMPEGGVTYQMIRRNYAQNDRANSRRFGYQTMLGSRAYLRLAQQQYPARSENGKTIILPLEEQLMEAGLKLGGRFNLLARRFSHRDLPAVDGTVAGTYQRVNTSLLALRGAVGRHDRFSFAGGTQSDSRDQGPKSSMVFADLQAKIASPLADWAKEASNKGIFDDHHTYGARDLPGWAQFADGGLHLQFVKGSGRPAASRTTYLAGAQTMLGKRMYLKASLLQNPLNDQNKVAAGRRMLYEFGTQSGKFTALARHISDHDDASGKFVESNYFAVRSHLSQRERVEALVTLDKVNCLTGDYARTTFGVEYAREVNDGHYFTIKGTITQDGDPTKAAAARQDLRLDLGFKKPI